MRGRRARGALVVGLAVALGAVLAGGCQASSSCRFDDVVVDLARDSGGAPSPVAAAEAFTRTSVGAGFPRSGWEQVSPTEVRSGHDSLTVDRLTDGTYGVTAGRSGC